MRTEASMPGMRGQARKLGATHLKQRLVIAGFHIDIRLRFDAVIDDDIQSVAFANGRNRTIRAIAEQPIDFRFIGHLDILTESCLQI